MAEERRHPSPHGDTWFSWEVDEFPVYPRGPVWYLVAGLVGLALLWYALATVNFLFGLIVIIFGIVLVLSSNKSTRRVSVAFTDDGIEVGKRFHPWTALDTFWVVYHPPVVTSIFFTFKDSMHPAFGIPLEGHDPSEIRLALQAVVREDMEKEAEPFSDSLARLLRL